MVSALLSQGCGIPLSALHSRSSWLKNTPQAPRWDSQLQSKSDGVVRLEPLLKWCSLGYNCCHPSWPHHTEAESCHSSGIHCFLLSGSWAALSVLHLRSLPCQRPMLPWHNAVLQACLPQLFSFDSSKIPSFVRTKSISVYAFLQ